MARSSRPLYITFDDNRHLPLLFGQHDENLLFIEKKLDISLTVRGNRLAISGSPEQAHVAYNVLMILYQRIKLGFEINDSEIDAAINLSGKNKDQSSRGDSTNDSNKNKSHLKEEENFLNDNTIVKTQKKSIIPRTHNQKNYLKTLYEKDLVFAIGPAGTGKTYLAVAIAVMMLSKGNVDRIILSRPAVEAGERLGFLPGDLREKVDPYLRPLYDALYDMLPAEQVIRRINAGDIEIAPLAFMRGRTLTNSFIILDEAQNTTPVQMKMFLTRLGERSRMVVTGDLTQIDLPKDIPSGLRHAMSILEHIPDIGIVRFDEQDVVRHPLVSKMVLAYKEKDQKL
ncbi:MAG: PhoH family protein [Alphaproteobacteria bacterium]|nr:PhoH family protein [Alphaproteobacteria bacterium]